MVFSSSIFLFGFLPALIFLYYISDKKFKNIVLLFFSLLFYSFGGLRLLFLMIFVVFTNYLFAILVDEKKLKKYRKIIFIFGIFINLIILFYFKYFGFFVDILNKLSSLNIVIPEIILPIGISFYTFQSLSYLIDVYKKKVKVQWNFLNLLLYVSMFPQLVAGPIVRYSTIDREISNRKVTIDSFTLGLERFIFGLSKKLIIANNVGHLADTIYSFNSLTTLVAWLGAISYTLQIYFDFSAYSDMAIGLGKMFGFNFNENFNYPYISKSITEFWRRWHISLSTWFRDYVYIPLGGNKKGIRRQIINLLIVWSLTGLWHGAAINFVLWGLYYFVFLMIEKFVIKKYLDKLPGFIQHFYTIIIVIVGWVLFRAENLEQCMKLINAMFVPSHDNMTFSYIYMYMETYGLYLIMGVIFSTPIFIKLKEYLFSKNNKDNFIIYGLYYLFVFLLFILCIIFLSKSSYNPFIYFRF